MNAAGKWMICPICKGEGSYVNPIDSNGLTGEDFADDPDFPPPTTHGPALTM